MKKDVITALFCLAVSIFFYYSLGWIDDERATSFPRVVIIIMGILSLLLLVQTLAAQKIQKGKPFPWKSFAGMFVLIVVYFFFMEKIGFYVSAFLFFIATALIFDTTDLQLKRVLSRVAVSAGFICVIYFLFKLMLKVQTPTGWLF